MPGYFFLKGTALFPLNQNFFAEGYGTFFLKIKLYLSKDAALFSAQEKLFFEGTALLLPTKNFLSPKGTALALRQNVIFAKGTALFWAKDTALLAVPPSCIRP